MQKHTPAPWTVREVAHSNVPGQRAFAIDFNEDQEQVVDWVYEEADAKLIAQAPGLLADLIIAAGTLRHYEALHRAKGTAESTEKAEVNAGLAARFEQTIAKATQ
ncbi:hypothetical protein [Pseudomonas protegens]|uniref:hypothetical protein n=1 Tax=Pseudomonas protegens TaxID=380021 RepID=UPI001B309439|nr:hypothetical protein [Pseudomonas protegens]MBP5097958.1 hypothetical protein [Pseudomonas protegens]QTU06119.1 hypothetical protein HUT25_10305 [Pseudomonas protegens]QTU12429.1 hypothetical protein HUT23_10995 [Pseudomonas protegens]QTU40193.1 hypothetical protein HUT24_21305 [Pseudomonas protegens]